MTSDKRLIELSFPIKEVGAQSAKEKSIRHGHPSTLHVWWARRPLAASRTTCYAALIPSPEDEELRTKKIQFIINFSKWKNTNNTRLINLGRKDILEANNGIPPRILDPFAGGGSIPLEAFRLGCETYSLDLNPVAVLLQKCTIEFPYEYGQRLPSQNGNSMVSTENPLLEEVEKWGNWALEEAQKELQEYYISSDREMPIGYLWAKTIRCQNPACHADIPLFKQFWLARKENRKIALHPIVKSNNSVEFEIVGENHKPIPKDFNPAAGTISRAVARCLVCKSTVDAPTTRRLFQEKKSGQKLIVVISKSIDKPGKTYRIAKEDDISRYKKARKQLERKRKILEDLWTINPIPNEPTPEGGGSGAERAFSNRNYGLESWSDFYNERQLLALLVFVEKIRKAHKKISQELRDDSFARAVTTYLALNLDRLASYCSSLGYWHVTGEKVTPAMQRQAIAMVFDYVESNPLATSFSWSTNLSWILRVIEQCSMIPKSTPSVPLVIEQSSATNLRFPSNYFDAVFTDPPYYDNVPYSYLSDFYYVWLKRTVGHLYPELFSTPLSPKGNEIVAYSYGAGGLEEGKRYFEENLSNSFREIHRVLKPGGIAVIVYAHKSTKGWETFVNSLLDSGLVMTSAWPIHTEMTGRLRAMESAALASSIYISARKVKKQLTGVYRDVKKELEVHMGSKLENLWTEGIGGADFFIAAIGSAIEVFGKYNNVIDFEGNTIRADRLLDDVRSIATNFALQQILHDGFSKEVQGLTRFYVLYRWNYGNARIQFDEARKLAQTCGIDLTEYWSGHGIIKKEKEFIRVLGPQDRKLEKLHGQREMIDVLQYILLLWEKGKRKEISEVLARTKFTRNEGFWRVAQAISETLPIQNKEKKLLDGFLAGRNGYREDEQFVQETLE